MAASIDTRPSPIAGQWYPGESDRLATSVDNYIQQAQLPSLNGSIIAIIAPHAGHTYSGPVAGFSFAAIRGMKPDLVAIISPCHYPYPQALLTTAHEAYATPLGSILVDRTALQSLDSILRQELDIGLTAVKRDPEHSLEIELPFLQRSLGGEFHLLPVMVRDQSYRTVRGLGQALAKVLRDRSALMVASTDLSHFYTQKEANILDSEMLRRMEAFDPDGVLRAEEEGVGFACGRAAVAAVLWAAQDLGADTVQVLQHATSGDVTGDYHQVVGYGAAVVMRQHH